MWKVRETTNEPSESSGKVEEASMVLLQGRTVGLCVSPAQKSKAEVYLVEGVPQAGPSFRLAPSRAVCFVPHTA